MKIKNLVRENILNLKPYTSARSSYLSGILLDANENGFGSVVEDEYSLELNRYPDPAQKSLRKKMSEYLNVPEANICFGVGSDEIIDLLIRIFCEPRIDKVMILQPTYGMYKVACDINNVKTINIDLTESFQIDFGKIKEFYSDEVKIIFLCSPNNPTGGLISKSDIINLADSCDSIIAVDEAYIDFSENDTLTSEVLNHNNIVVIRTFSKAWGLAGIRCGYCVADEFIISLLMNVKAPYNINKFIFHIINEAISRKSIKDDFVTRILQERERVFNELINLKGIDEVYHSDSNFLLFRCDNSKNILNSLAEKGIIIRERSGHKYLNNCLRVTIGTVEENMLFLKSIKELL